MYRVWRKVTISKKNPFRLIWKCYRRTDVAKLEAHFFVQFFLFQKNPPPQNYKKCESLEVVTAKLLQKKCAVQLDPEDSGATFLRNVANFKSNNRESHSHYRISNHLLQMCYLYWL